MNFIVTPSHIIQFVMLTTSIIPPNPDLKDFIYNYSLCASESRIRTRAIPWVADDLLIVYLDF
jgi:hypothetical protein